MYGRTPAAQAHMKAKKVRGIAAGIDSGKGSTRFSNHRSSLFELST